MGRVRPPCEKGKGKHGNKLDTDKDKHGKSHFEHGTSLVEPSQIFFVQPPPPTRQATSGNDPLPNHTFGGSQEKAMKVATDPSEQPLRNGVGLWVRTHAHSG